MSLTRQVANNTFIHVIGKIISLILSLVAFAFVARYLGQSGFGQFTTIMAYVQAFAIFSDLGLYMIFVQMLSLPHANEKKLCNNFFTLRFFSSFILLGLASLIAIFIPQYSYIIKIGIAITAISFVFGSLIQVLTGFFQKKIYMRGVACAEIIARIILLGLIGMFIWSGKSILFILLAIVISGFINFILVYLFSIKFIKIKFVFDFHMWLKILKKAWPVGISIILTTIYFKGDTIILSLFKHSEEVGIYGAAYRILEALIMLPPIFMGLVLPHMTNAWAKKDKKRFKKIFQKSFDFLIILILPLIIGVLFLAKPIMIFIAGNEFAVSAGPLKVLIFATGLIFLGSLVTYTIIALEKQKHMLKFYIISAIIAITGYLIFIPKYSYWGAAYTTVLVEFLITFFAFFIIYKTSKILPSLHIFFKVFLSSVIMGLFLFTFSELNLFLLICISVFIYFVFLYLLNGIDKRTVKQIFKPNI